MAMAYFEKLPQYLLGAIYRETSVRRGVLQDIANMKQVC
jgi:hypothetical protein